MDLEPLIQRAELDASRFFAGLRDIETALGRTSRSTDQISRNMTSAFRAPLVSLNLLRNALGGISAALGVRQVIQYAEAYTVVQNQLRVSGVESQNLAAATQEIFDIAVRTRAPVEQMAEVFARVATAGGELGISMREAFEFTDLVGKSVAIAGASSAAASGALTQLAQAMGGTVVQAQEFNSIIDGARPLLVAAARGIDEAGGSVARLRSLVINGQITAQEFFRGIMAGAEAITGPFERAVVRPSQAMQVLRTSIIQTIGEMDQASGGTAGLSRAITGLAEAIRSPEFQSFAQDVVAGIGREIAGLHAGMVSIVPEIRSVGAALDALTDVDLGDLDLLRNTLREIATIKQFGSAVASGDVAGALETLTRSSDLAERLSQVQDDINLATERRNQLLGTQGEALTAQEERLAALRVEEVRILELLRQQNAERAKVPDLVFEKDMGARFGPLFGTEKIPGGARAGTPPATGAAKTTFADIIEPLRTRLNLLQQTQLSEDRIGEIIAAQGRLKRNLTTAEREALNAVNAAVDAEEELRQKAEDRTEAAKDFRVAITGQIEDQQALIAYGGQETEEYRLQVAMLKAKRDLMQDLNAEQRALVEAAVRAETRAQTAAAMTDLRKRRETADFESGHALESGFAEITGLPESRGLIAERERFRMRMEGKSAEQIETLEPLIQDMARAQQQLTLMTETAPKLAGTLAEIGQIAVFEGLEDAGERFLEMLVDMLFQMIALGLVMKALGFISGNPAAAASGFLPGPGAGLNGFGGPRQHGGPVDPRRAYLVGEAGPELFVPSSSGQIVPGARAAGAAGAGAQINVNVINNAPNTQVDAQQDEQSGRIDILIDEMVANNMRPGTATSRAMRDQFGLQFQTRR